ncbi:hypothetical protein M0M57_11465 [Flavobacterium azooxidireducens]|uniref:Uncharacterized protein n=1 Tax=Flavobacterium azooxidireducens TaxID=1871076 RepID=A0ABY4KD48_9FLAO|nr:hypothetical protein [Flavobacterium azooxidireducens]UPQ78236.1 hypothetical protein M0M57_11465 [Flavobacterium azooxidireducens]
MKLKIMSLKTKAFLFQLISFAVFFIPFRIAIDYFTPLERFWPPFFAFIITLILAPKFQVAKTKEGEQLFMKWIFLKGVKSI